VNGLDIIVGVVIVMSAVLGIYRGGKASLTLSLWGLAAFALAVRVQAPLAVVLTPAARVLAGGALPPWALPVASSSARAISAYNWANELPWPDPVKQAILGRFALAGEFDLARWQAAASQVMLQVAARGLAFAVVIALVLTALAFFRRYLLSNPGRPSAWGMLAGGATGVLAAFAIVALVFAIGPSVGWTGVSETLASSSVGKWLLSLLLKINPNLFWG
jgi:hypothetical protein